jgi:type III secretion protein T
MEQGLAGILAIFRAFEGYLLAFLLAMPRAYAFVWASQLLAPTAVPRLARNVAILVITLPIVPLTLPYTGLFVGQVGLFIAYFAKEFALGILLGYLVFWIFWAVQAAGTLIDNQRGAAIASSIDPLQGHEAAPLGLLFSQAFITYFFSVGGFLVLTMLLYRSYPLWPITEMIPITIEDFPELIFAILDSGMRLAFVLAAPIVAIMFLAEFALAMVSRFAPQIQVFILAMPIKSALAIFVLIFYIPIMLDLSLTQARGIDGFYARFYEILRAARALP